MNRAGYARRVASRCGPHVGIIISNTIYSSINIWDTPSALYEPFSPLCFIKTYQVHLYEKHQQRKAVL